MVGLGAGCSACATRCPPNCCWAMFYLCALPSTVSSSVAMTSMARGNVPGAIFNATISGLIGMAVTPLLMGLVISASGASMPLGKALTGVALQLLLPFALGQPARPLIGSWLAKKKQITSEDRPRRDRADRLFLSSATPRPPACGTNTAGKPSVP
ncbi:bile acid:sodium symporter [Cupriavidus basilensis]